MLPGHCVGGSGSSLDARTARDVSGCAYISISAPNLAATRVQAAAGTASWLVVTSHNLGNLSALISAIDKKDHCTRRHSERVTAFALRLGEAMGMAEETLHALLIAGLLHDVGKIGVPDGILRKPGPLSDSEYAAIKQHPTLGELIARDHSDIPDVLAAISTHHERYDGRGYPRGLVGGEIPLLGRILAVADAYSAMTSDRPYRRALDPQDAIAELTRAAGSQLDPELVMRFMVFITEDQDRERRSGRSTTLAAPQRHHPPARAVAQPAVR